MYSIEVNNLVYIKLILLKFIFMHNIKVVQKIYIHFNF